MVSIYADLVIAGKRSLDGADGIPKVPNSIIGKVIDELTARGYFDEVVEESPEDNIIQDAPIITDEVITDESIKKLILKTFGSL